MMFRRRRIFARLREGWTYDEVYDDEAGKKLLDKINRITSNLGVDEVIAGAVQAHLKKIGEIPADERARVKGRGWTLRVHSNSRARRARSRHFVRRLKRNPDFVT
jgi:hypothetical protein